MSNFNSSNSKMNKLRKQHALPKAIKTFGIPAVKTCPEAGSCKSGFDLKTKKKYTCFATQGTYTWPVVKAAYERRFKHSKKDYFVDDMIKEIGGKQTTHVRLHDSGDFYSDTYLWKWINIMENCPDTKFWAYTKAVSRMKAFKHLLPDNFYYVFSEGGKQDHLIDPAKDRYSKCISEDREQVFKHNGFKDLSQDELQILDNNNKLFFTVAH